MGASGLFGLNDCLADGKNYLRITAKDNARSNSDGISLISNATLYVSGLGSANYPDGTSAPSTIGTATINIDEAAPGVKLSGDAKSYYDSNAASNCFIGLATKDPRWKNFTISGGIQAADPFGPNCAPTVSVITPTILTCNFPIAGIGDGNPNSPIYNSPAGVDSVTGKFTAFTYDGFGPTPTIAACDWGCKSGYTKNTATNTCESAAIHICPAGQSWDGVQCAGLPFCTAGGSVPCIVAPGGSANTCSTSKPSCDGTSCALTTGSPSSNNQTWVKGAVNCGFACTNGYTGANCEVAPVANTCCGAYTTTYCYADNGNIIAGNPVISC